MKVNSVIHWNNYLGNWAPDDESSHFLSNKQVLSLFMSAIWYSIIWQNNNKNKARVFYMIWNVLAHCLKHSKHHKKS